MTDRNHKSLLALLVVLTFGIAISFVLYVGQLPRDNAPPARAPFVASHHADPILPDSRLTPGEVLPDATLEKVKQHGYSATTRDVDEAKKKAVFARYGIPWERHAEFEVDHLCAASIGGASTLANLWPQKLTGLWGAKVKDRLEVHVLAEVRAEKMDLHEAQKKMCADWISFYREVFKDGPKEAAIADEEQ